MITKEEIQRVKQRFSIVGNSPALTMAIERAVRVAPIDLSVLVTGESGSGKEFFPKIIHQFGARKHKKYIAVNCGAIPEGTIDSELFGHEKGSFTGAVSARKGYFEEADGGTIFLDEVAELPLTTQARLLRVLETGEFLKVGSSTVQKTDIRIVAATNVDLPDAVAKGKFREDLYYRLSTVVINVPPLHDRGDDVLLLARKFASSFSEKYMTEPISFSEDANRALILYRWPGNVRQLKNIVEQLALFRAGQVISRNDILDLLPKLRQGDALPLAPAQDLSDSERKILWQMILGMRREIDELRAELHSGETGKPEAIRTHAVEVDCDHDTRHGLIRYPVEEVIPRMHDSDEGAEEVPPRTLEDAERTTIAAALLRNGGDKKRTAEELNISPRTLYRKIREYNLQ